MDKITGLLDYKSLLKQSRGRFTKVINNTPLLADEAERHIQHGKLYYKEFAFGSVFYVCEKDFYKLYCYFDADTNWQLPKLDKPQIIEVVYRSGSSNKWLQAIDQKNQLAGFTPYVLNQHIKTELASIDKSTYIDDFSANDLSWGYVTMDELIRVYDIWSANLDPYDSIIPTEAEAEELVNGKELICIRKNNIITSVARLKHESPQTCSSWLVATHKDYFRQGMALRLYKAMINLAIQRNYVYLAQWSDINNIAIFKTVSKLGFSPDGYESKEYIMLTDNEEDT